MFNTLAHHTKPAAPAPPAAPDDKKTRCLTDTMANWGVAHISDILPASIRPLIKKPSGEHAGSAASSALAARATVDEDEAPVFAPASEWSMQLVQKLQYLSQMTKGEVGMVHGV
jgi:hypothetical protein